MEGKGFGDASKKRKCEKLSSESATCGSGDEAPDALEDVVKDLEPDDDDVSDIVVDDHMEAPDAWEAALEDLESLVLWMHSSARMDIWKYV